MLLTGLLTLQTMFVEAGSLGGTIHVPTDAPTIQIAIEDSQPFDTIIVAPGTYFEAIGFHGKVITVQSTNPNDPSVVAATIINAGYHARNRRIVIASAHPALSRAFGG